MMMLPRLITLVLFLLPNLPAANAQTSYPDRPVHIVVGYPAGGTTDIVARLIGRWLSERLGQSFIVENKPGAGSNLAAESVINAPPDGYRLMLTSAANAVNQSLYKKISFVFVRDTVPVVGVIRVPNVMVVIPDVPAKTVAEFVDYAKANPDKLNLATTGSNLSGAMFMAMTGVKMLEVSYRGSAPALTELLAGRMQVMFDNLPASLPHIQAGKLRPLGVTTTARSDLMPDIPPVSDAVPGYESSAWFGFSAPKGTPPDIVMKLNQEINAALKDQTILARLKEIGGMTLGGSPEDFGKLIAAETEKWEKVIKFANISVN
jgi:tripartite-type tricarboxylate transporter receptor subunit TctC